MTLIVTGTIFNGLMLSMLLYNLFISCVCVLVTQSCPTLCNLMDCSPPGSSVHRILQARILAWLAFPFSRGSSPPRDWTLAFCISCIGRGILYLLSHWGFPVLLQPYSNSDLFITNSKLFLFYHPQWSPKATQMTHLLTWRYPWQSFHWAKEKFFK